VLSGGARRNAVRPKAAGLVLDTLCGRRSPASARAARRPARSSPGDVAERREFIGFMRLWWPADVPENRVDFRHTLLPAPVFISAHKTIHDKCAADAA